MPAARPAGLVSRADGNTGRGAGFLRRATMPDAMTGLLLINLGTPEQPRARAVRRYLRQFLSDPRVLDIHPVWRAALLHLVILPFRPARAAEAYQKVWTERG